MTVAANKGLFTELPRKSHFRKFVMKVA